MSYTITEYSIPGLPGETMRAAVNASGHYIGLEDDARYICGERGIAPELASPSHSTCSIGFNEAEQKWYGWSHRAMFGFGVGSTVKRGDCGYIPAGWDDFLGEAAEFWKGDGKLNLTVLRGIDDEGRDCANVAWEYNNTVPNKKIRGKVTGCTVYPPAQWGKGEWTATTLEQAKQMAIDFADGVS